LAQQQFEAVCIRIGLYSSKMMTRKLLAVLALLIVSCQAEDVEVAAAEGGAEAAAPAEGEEAAAEGSEGSDEEKGQKFVDSAKELQEKLGQLKALLDAKGEGADPGLKDRLAGLESQLKDLGLDGLTGGGGSNPELTEFLGACVAMSMRRAGMQRPATLGALRKLVENKLAPADAAQNELWRMVAVCVADFREDEFSDFKAGRIKILPKSYVDASKKPEAEKKVMEIDAQVWDELRKISDGLLTELSGGGNTEKPPFNAAYLAMIPLGIVFAYLGKSFMDMQKRGEEKSKKGKKEGKKSK